MEAFASVCTSAVSPITVRSAARYGATLPSNAESNGQLHLQSSKPWLHRRLVRCNPRQSREKLIFKACAQSEELERRSHLNRISALPRRHLLAFAGLSVALSDTLQRSTTALAAAASDVSSNTPDLPASPNNNQLIRPTPRETILRILEERGGAKNGGWGTLYAGKEVQQQLDEAVTALVAENPTSAPGSQSIRLGQGTWEVFHAPHITRISSFGATKFEPIQYILRGDHIDSNVRYSAPLLGSGWLSAAGGFREKDTETVEVLFDSFWWDTGFDGLTPDPAGKGSWLTSAINSVGRAMFFPQLSLFPVLYLDQDIAVFEFPPLRTKIAVARLLST